LRGISKTKKSSLWKIQELLKSNRFTTGFWNSSRGWICRLARLPLSLHGLVSREEKPPVGEPQIRYLSPDPNTPTTDLYPRTKAKIDQQMDHLLREKVVDEQLKAAKALYCH